jgi:Cu(I)/Ag(I) efflux system membrane fusion protein
MNKLFFLVVAIATMSIGSAYAQQTGHQAHSQDTVSQKESKTEVKGTQATLAVQGLCGMCKTRIEKTAKGVAGVTSATWDSKTKTLNLDYDGSKTSLDVVGKAIAKVGHDTDKYKADDKVYAALPGCCKYRK